MEYKTIILCFLVSLAFAVNDSFLSNSPSPLVPVSKLDLIKFDGIWYEIARLSDIFEKRCYCATTNYTMNTDGFLEVENTCNWGSATGHEILIDGKAYPQDAVVGSITTGKFDVEFTQFRSSPLYVIDIGEQYEYALLGSPDRSTLWMLAREPVITEYLYDVLVKKAVKSEFDVENFAKVYQGEDCGNIF